MQLKPLFSRRPGADAGARDGYDDFWYGPASRPTAAGVTVTVERALKLPVVYDCLQVLSQTVGALPFGIFERGADGSKIKRDDHPLMRVLRDPNPETSDVEFMGQLVFDLASEGDAFLEMRGGSLGPISQLWRREPDTTDVKRLSDKSKLYEFREDDGTTTRMTDDDVWHIKVFPHVHNGLRGLSPIEAGRDAIGAAIALQDFAARFFQNDCTPPFVLEHPNYFSDQASRETFLQAIKRWWGGTRRHSPGLLEFGIKLNRVGIHNDEAQFLETRNATDHALARLWRMPPHKVGLLDKATNNNIEHQGLEFVTDTLLPWLRLIERSVIKYLLLGPDRERFIFEFNVAGLLRGDIRARYEAFSKGRQWGWLSVNEIRRMENLNPIAGGDQFLTPLNMVPAGSIGSDPRDQQQSEEDRAADRLINGPRRLIYGPDGNAVSGVFNGHVVRDQNVIPFRDNRHAA